ncbi:hypothetical protein [Siminovitchia fordii]|uniref:Uncharacterized protein n=1 Tax=Siminovitchia fordii TaxID=254759 RepID=A0ABQ4KA99_9BACI|nr:hypothetical protein [Siminovitchia fordii]GIN22647.1 hypothetical protein J1TS3_37810 [Siminovitchia fordii]
MRGKFNLSEVKSYLEWKSINGITNDEEDELYIDIQWSNNLEIHRKTINNLIREMRDINEHGY